jgi:uncharacterized protein (TIGR02246 family)
LSAKVSAIDPADVAAVPAKMVAAWAAHDAAAFADLFHPDGTMILPGVYVKGREAIREYMAAAYLAQYKDTRVTGSPLDMKFLDANVVALISTGGVIAAGATELAESDTIRATWTLVRRDGTWRLAVYHNCQQY